MKRLDFPLLLDTCFYALAAGFLSLGILRYFRVPLLVASFCALLFALAAGVLCFLTGYLTHRRRAVSKKEREEKDALMLHLALETRERVRALLLDASLRDGKQAALQGDALTVEGVPLIPLFCMEPVSADAVAQLLRERKEEPFCLACNALTGEAEKLLFSFGKKTLCGDEVYVLLKRTDTYPEKLICSEIPRRTYKTKFRAAFSKKNARPFFVSGLLLLVMSLFVIFPVYYLVTGASLMITAVFVRAVGYA